MDRRRRNLLRFYDWPNPDYFMCRSCSNHIVLRRDFTGFYWGPQMPHIGIFNTAENVREGQALHDQQQIAPIYCENCHRNLGHRSIEAGNDMVSLIMNRLSRMRGELIVSGDALLNQIIENDIDLEDIQLHPNGIFEARIRR